MSSDRPDASNGSLIRVLHQAKTWTTAEGETLRIAKMDSHHLRNVLSYLLEHRFRLAAEEGTDQNPTAFIEGTRLFGAIVAELGKRGEHRIPYDGRS